MRAANRGLPIEIEAQSLDQVDDALRAGADIVLLDNLSTPDILEAVRRCRGRAKTEISGGVTLARLPELAVTGADYVSVGALTHSAPADLSLEIEPGEAPPPGDSGPFNASGVPLTSSPTPRAARPRLGPLASRVLQRFTRSGPPTTGR
jgi:hypothetical protein